MRVLVTTQPQGSHFWPMVPYLRALEEAGHEVLVGSGREFLATVRDAGFTGVDCGLDWTLQRPVPEQVGAIGLRGDAQRAAFMGFFTGRAARHMAHDVLAIADHRRPDVVLWDATEFGAPLAAEKLAVPHLPISIAMRQSAARLEPFTAPIAALRSDLGLPLDSTRTSYYRYGCLSLFPPEWLSSDDVPLDGEVFLAPFPDWRAEDEAERWLETLPEGPIVYATLGSIFAVLRGPLEAMIAGLGGGDWSVIVATGGMRDPRSLSPVPPNVRIETWVPQRAVLRRAALVVHHAGYSTCMDAALAGVPQAVLPLTADQPEHAAAVRRLGLGETVPEVIELPMGPMVDREALSPTSIRETARRTWADGGYTERSVEFGARLRSLPGLDTFVAAVEDATV